MGVGVEAGVGSGVGAGVGVGVEAGGVTCETRVDEENEPLVVTPRRPTANC